MFWEVLALAPFEKKEDYLEEIKTQIRCKKAKSMIIEEVENHIEDQKNAYLSAGMEESIAMEKALVQMGDPIAVGKQLDKIHRPRMEWYLFLVVMGLSILGILIQISLNQVADAAGIPFFDYRKHILYLLVGIIVMFFAYFIDYTVLGRYPKLIWMLLLLGILLYGPIAPRINGSCPYLYAYAMLFLPVFGGILYAYRKCGYFGILKCLFFSFFTVIIVRGFVVKASIYIGILLSCLLMLSLAVWKNWFHTSKAKSLLLIWGWIFVPVLAVIFRGKLLLRSYQLSRLQKMFAILRNPGQFDQGYRMNVARQIILHAEVFGDSLHAEGGYKTVLHSDYILTFVIGKYGLAAGILVISLFILFIGRMIYIALKQKNALGRYVGFGCVLVYAIQGVVYILANLSVGLFAQVNLPFISYSGASLIVNFVVLGIILSIFRNSNIRKEEPYKKRFRIKIESIH